MQRDIERNQTGVKGEGVCSQKTHVYVYAVVIVTTCPYWMVHCPLPHALRAHVQGNGSPNRLLTSRGQIFFPSFKSRFKSLHSEFYIWTSEDEECPQL